MTGASKPPLRSYDAAIVGGGIMGCGVAVHLADAGLEAVVLERRAGLCMEASSNNTGALMLQLVRAAFIPYALRGIAMWRDAPAWLGADMGYVENGGLTLAFNDHEAGLLQSWMADRAAAGAPIEIIDGASARRLEPALSDHAVLASTCALDGYADATRTGRGYHQGLAARGVEIRCNAQVGGIEPVAGGFELAVDGGRLRAGRVILAGGVWLGRMLDWFGLDIPIECRVNQVSVTERLAPVMRRSICAATGRLSLKQSQQGTVLVGGGWQGIGGLDEGGRDIIPENLVANLRLACHAVPALKGARLVRSWLGLEAKVPDYMPVMGPVPGVADAFVLGAVHAGYTLGPILGKLLAQQILGQDPEMPIPASFDPARLLPERRDALEVWGAG